MTSEDFLHIYLPALEAALKHDAENSGYHVKLPVEYVKDDHLVEVENFIESNYNEFKHLFDLEAIYFDAVSHYFSSVGNMSIYELKAKLQRYIIALSYEYEVTFPAKK